MKKGISLSLGALLLVGMIVFAIWYINEEGKMHSGSKEAFIPYNSAIVVHVNSCPAVTQEFRQAFLPEVKEFRRRLLTRVVDTLQKEGYIISYPYVIAARIEGKSDVALLYVMDNKDVLSRSEITRFLNRFFSGNEERMRKYDKHKIYTLQRGKEEIYFAVCGGIVLISDSDLYIEDGLKQFDQEEVGNAGNKPLYQDLSKYFSSEAEVNVFLNTAAFTDLLPLYVQTRKLFPHMDVNRFFKWGALDGEFVKQGFCFNGFLHYGGLEHSYITAFKRQQAREFHIEGVVPARINAVGMLNLSDPAAYFTALEAYRYTIGEKETVFDRKQQFRKMFGKGAEEEMRSLLQGEFAIVELSYNEATQKKEGLVIAGVKSGSLCTMLVDKMMKSYAWFDKKEISDYRRTYSVDREKTFSYYYFPVEDWAEMYWGSIFEGVKSRYILVEDNYLILATSEEALRIFIQDYVHSSFIRDASWYHHLKSQLSGKSNFSYFARTADVFPFYNTAITPRWKNDIDAHKQKLTLFPSFALQWSNEGDMLYSTLYFSSSKIQEETRPHVLWQTKLEAKVSMKPVPVINHVTQEKELFVQDDRNTVYLMNDGGRVLWKFPLDDRINSDVYQVDLFKNGKLQYLFSTTEKMYLIDRNGNAAGRFPVTFKSKCEQGITVYDYDNNRNYRIFAPAFDRKVYLYNLTGDLVQGWESRKADKSIVTKVSHFRVEGKDYIVYADQYRLYILDRKGKERVQVASVFDLKSHTAIYLTRRGGQPCLVFAGKKGNLNLVDFSGRTEQVKTAEFSDGYQMNVADLDGNDIDECIFTDGGKLLAYRLDGQLMYEKTFEAKQLGYPYIYRFSVKDERVGLADGIQGKMFLLMLDGSMSEGFPIAGDSPFSIVFSGNDGFFLYAGADRGSVIKYKVQR